MGQRGAVVQLDQGVDDRLGMHDDVDLLVAHPEQMVGLDQLEPLVHQRGRVDRDLAAHRPSGVREGLLDRHPRHVRGRAATERAAGRGEDQLVNGARPLGGDQLVKRRVL